MHRIQRNPGNLVIQTSDLKTVRIRNSLSEDSLSDLEVEPINFSLFETRYGTLSELNRTYITKLIDELHYTEDEVIKLMDVFPNAQGVWSLINVHNIKNLNELKPYFELAKKTSRLLQNEINFNLLANQTPKPSQFCSKKNYLLDAFFLQIMAYAFFKPMSISELEEIFISTIINLKLFLEKTVDHLAQSNSVMLLFISFLVTYKSSQDFFYKNNFLTETLTLDLKQVNSLEAYFLTVINWQPFFPLRLANFVEYERIRFCLENCMTSRNGFSPPTVSMIGNYEQVAKENYQLLFNKDISQPLDLQEAKSTQLPLEVKQTTITSELSPKQVMENEKLTKQQDQIIKQVTDVVNIGLSDFPQEVHPLEFLLFEIIDRVDLSDSKNQALWIDKFNQVLIALKKCRELERQKGVSEDQIRPNLDVEDLNETSPLVFALRRECSSLALVLIAEGANPDHIDITGDSPLFLASMFSLSCTNLLLSKKANVEVALNQYVNWQRSYEDLEKDKLRVSADISDLEKEIKQAKFEDQQVILDKMAALKKSEESIVDKLNRNFEGIAALGKNPDPFFLVIEKGIELKAIKDPQTLCKFLSLMQPNDKDSPFFKQIENLRKRIMGASTSYARLWQPVCIKEGYVEGGSKIVEPQKPQNLAPGKSRKE